jgi:hypothetical protein
MGMTNAELESLYKENVDISHLAALRAVFNAGYFASAGITPTAQTADQSRISAKPAVRLHLNKPD